MDSSGVGEPAALRSAKAARNREAQRLPFLSHPGKARSTGENRTSGCAGIGRYAQGIEDQLKQHFPDYDALDRSRPRRSFGDLVNDVVSLLDEPFRERFLRILQVLVYGFSQAGDDNELRVFIDTHVGRPQVEEREAQPANCFVTVELTDLDGITAGRSEDAESNEISGCAVFEIGVGLPLLPP